MQIWVSNAYNKEACGIPRIFFFLSGFSFTDTDNSQDSRGREGTILFHSTTSTNWFAPATMRGSSFMFLLVTSSAVVYKTKVIP